MPRSPIKSTAKLNQGKDTKKENQVERILMLPCFQKNFAMSWEHLIFNGDNLDKIPLLLSSLNL